MRKLIPPFSIWGSLIERRWLWWLWSFRYLGTWLPISHPLIVCLQELAIAFLLRLIRGLGGILIKALAALVVYVTHDFRYFHHSYLAKAEFQSLLIVKVYFDFAPQ